MASLRLRTEPTVHQVDVILACVEGALGARAARVRRGSRGEVRFRMPPPWQAPGAGLLRLVSGGEVNVIAGWGEPRRLRYELNFVPLYLVATLATAAFTVTGWDGPRLALLRSVLLLWGVVLLLRLVVARQVRGLLAVCAHEIVERRAGEGEGSGVGRAEDGRDGTGTT
jgi:hypothetical protein